jgi:26S proteasome regulatory subunit N8
VKTNDMHLVMYLTSLIRSILALHGLLTNKLKYRDIDDVIEGVDTKKEKEKEGAAAKDSKDDKKVVAGKE